jgi:hypothetical protein
VIALAITALICVSCALVAYWARDVALRWMAEGKAAEDCAAVRAEVEMLAADVRSVDRALRGHDGLIEQMDARIKAAEELATQAKTAAHLNRPRA